MKKPSLVFHVIAGVLLAELLCALLLSAITLAHEINGRQRAFSILLRGRADSVLGAIHDSEQPDDTATVDPSELQLPRQDIYLVLDPSGRVLGQSSGLIEPLRQALSAPHDQQFFRFRSGNTPYQAVRLQGVRVIDRDDNGGIRRPVLIIYASPTRYLWHEAVEGVQFDLTVGAVLLILTGVALAWFLRRRLSPLEELAAIAGRVSPHSWDFVPPSSVLRTRELAPIAHSISQLLHSLRAAFERQRQLTGDAAHELKTSIAVLKSSLQLLIMRPRTAGEYERGLDGLLLDVERTEDLANRMLTHARLEETTAEETDFCNLSLAVQNTVQRLSSLAEIRKIRVEFESEPGIPVGLSPADAEVLCSNLIMNSLEHTPADGRIAVTVRRLLRQAELCIVDNGEGIPASAIPHIFDRFYRVDRSRSRQSGGAGLGLSICKALLDRAHGSIELQSTPGAGTEVRVTLPLTFAPSEQLLEATANRSGA